MFRPASERATWNAADALGPLAPPARSSGRLTSESVIAILTPMVSDRRRARLTAVLDARLDSVTVLMDSPRDPHNGAALLRSCDAFGVQTAHVVTRGAPFLVSRGVATGAANWVDVVEHDEPAHAARELGRAGYVLIGAHPEGELSPEELTSVPKLALVLGSEHGGICSELRDVTARSVRVAMRGFVESLNLSVAGAVLLAAATRGRPGDLSAARRQELYAQWLIHSVPRALEILDAVSEPPSDTRERAG